MSPQNSYKFFRANWQMPSPFPNGKAVSGPVDAEGRTGRTAGVRALADIVFDRYSMCLHPYRFVNIAVEHKDRLFGVFRRKRRVPFCIALRV